MTKYNFCVRQHYIPQFLQKGFTFDKNESQVFVIRADKIYPAHIKDNFVQNQFYSDIPKSNNEPKTLDQEITDHENQILNTLNNLKSLDMNKEYNIDSDLAHFFWHFTLRNKNFSESISDSLYEGLMEKFSENNLSIAVRDFCKKHSIELFHHISIIHNIKQKLNFKDTKQLKILEDKLFEFIMPTFLEETNKLLKLINKEDIRKIINSFSIKLNSNYFLTNYKFQILNGNFILPDTIISSYDLDFKCFIPLIGESEFFLFPINKNKILIGYLNEFPNTEIFDFNKINTYLIENSNSFIIDNKNNSDINSLKKELNKNTFRNNLIDIFLSNSQISSITKQLENDLLPILRKKSGYYPK